MSSLRKKNSNHGFWTQCRSQITYLLQTNRLQKQILFYLSDVVLLALFNFYLWNNFLIFFFLSSVVIRFFFIMSFNIFPRNNDHDIKTQPLKNFLWFYGVCFLFVLGLFLLARWLFILLFCVFHCYRYQINLVTFIWDQILFLLAFPLSEALYSASFYGCYQLINTYFLTAKNQYVRWLVRGILFLLFIFGWHFFLLSLFNKNVLISTMAGNFQMLNWVFYKGFVGYYYYGLISLLIILFISIYFFMVYGLYVIKNRQNTNKI